MNIKPQFITSADGSELVVITRAEFDMLMRQTDENDEEAAIFDERMNELRSKTGVVLPPEVAAYMLRGDSLLKALRKWRNQTQLDLEFKTGLSQSYISDLESGKKKGARETLRKIADALGIETHWLGV